MKIYKIYRVITFMFLAIFCFCSNLNAQSVDPDVTATVNDEQGNPLIGVSIYGPDGIKSSTNANGLFTIKLKNNQSVVIQKSGYESQSLSYYSIKDKIVLVKSDFLASEDDQIKMGITTKYRRNMTGAVSSINTNDRLTYDNTQYVRDYISGLTVGVRGSDNIRGLGSALFVVDGVFGRDPNILNMEEVDQITILKDANAVALYGSQGKNGVIIINTKRGKINRKEVNVNVRSGVSFPIALPKYLGAADFMELRNEAKINDGLPANDPSLFSSDRIANTRSGLNPTEFPDVNLYDYVKPSVYSTNVITEFSGGNDKYQHYVNLGWNRTGDWVGINDDINAGTNRFNLRGNIDFKVNKRITSNIDVVAVLSNTKGPQSNILNAASTFIPYDYATLIPVSSIDTTGNSDLASLLKGANVFNGYLLGTAPQIGLNSPVAKAIAGGYQKNVVRGTQLNNAINFDLSTITKGLTAKSYLSFDFLDSYTLSISNQFKTYAPTWQNNKVVSLQSFGVDLKDLTENATSNGFVSRLGMYGVVNYQKTFAKYHSINSSVLGYYNSQKRDNVIQTDKDAHIGFQITYDFKKKLFVDFSGAYVHSIKLPEGHRGGLSPTVGLSYILSEEAFLKGNNIIDYLKLKASGGLIKSDRNISAYYLYDENYSNGSTFTWADGLQSNKRQEVSQGANPNLGYEEQLDLNLGFESYLMKSLWIEGNYFRSEFDKQLVILGSQYPSYYNTFRPYNNFNANLYTGFELGINYKKSFNQLTVGIGSNVLYSKTKASKRSEINEFAYQNTQGRELSTIYGLVDQGFYSQSDFTANTDGKLVLNSNLPVPSFGAVQPGDIKYADQNNDNVIDQNDQIAIGRGSSPWTYGINLNVKYKAFNLFVLGTGQTGALGNKLNSSFNNYYAPNGTNKYSEVVLNRWTPQTADAATFPRLSANTNQNNFRTSTFWLYNSNFFRVNRAQLTYEFSDLICKKLGVGDFSLNVQGTNLFEFSEYKDVRQLNIGGDPQARTYTLGARVSF